MTEPPDILRPIFVAAAKLRLERLMENVPAMVGAFLATDDGFEITQVLSGREMEPARLAAMCSSMVALSHALVEESALGETQNLLIEAQRGKIILLTIPSKPKLSLTVIATPNATLGQVLVQAKICAQEILSLAQAL